MLRLFDMNSKWTSCTLGLYAIFIFTKINYNCKECWEHRQSERQPAFTLASLPFRPRPIYLQTKPCSLSLLSLLICYCYLALSRRPTKYFGVVCLFVCLVCLFVCNVVCLLMYYEKTVEPSS